MYQDRGRPDATPDDLGYSHAWKNLHRAVELGCPECGGRLFTQLSRHRLPHFYHQVEPRSVPVPKHHGCHRRGLLTWGGP